MKKRLFVGRILQTTWLCVCLGGATKTLGQTVFPFPDVSWATTNALPGDAVIYPPNDPPSFPAALPPNSPAPSVNFQGLGDDNTSIPPDTMGAVGPNHVVTMLNDQVQIQNRAGTVTNSTNSILAWWAGAGTQSQVFDPRIQYDPYNNRWIACIGADGPPFWVGTSGLLLAVSQTSDPTGSWYYQKISADPTNHVRWIDYPVLGFSKDWIVVSVNIATNNGVHSAVEHARIYMFNKTNALAGGSLFTTYDVPSTNGVTIVPAVTYENTISTVYLLGSWNSAPTNSAGVSTAGYLRLWTITGAVNSPTVTATTGFPSTGPWAFSSGVANFLPQASIGAKIDAGDARIKNVVYRNGYLWATHTVFLPYANPTHSAIQWWQIDTSGSVAQVARIEDANAVNSYAYPSIAVNRFNDMLVGYSSFSSNQYPSANYGYHAFTDGPTVTEPTYKYKAGVGPYYKTGGAGDNRWGDYSATWVDPVNDGDFWTVQEYAEANVGTGLSDGDGRWGAWWAKVSVGIPGNDNFTNASTITTGSGTTSGSNVRATKETGEPNHTGYAGGSSIWYQWTAPATGPVTFNTTGSSFTTLLGVYTGTSVSALTSVAPITYGYSATFTASSGTTYHIAVDGYLNAEGSVVLNWNQPSAPVFVLQPQTQFVIASNSVTFSALAIGVPDPTYQWQFNSNNISGATSTNYTISVPLTNNSGFYSVVGNNTHGSVTSQVAHLTVYDSATSTLSTNTYSTNNVFTFVLTGATGIQYKIQGSTDFATWTTLFTNAATFTYTNTVTTNFPYRFFRAVYN